ncbi:MAG: hypothetical protein AAF715_00505 [Myxococcota bacterium]
MPRAHARPRWLRDPSFDRRPLASLCLPGSHDSGAYVLQHRLAPAAAQQVRAAAEARRVAPLIRALGLFPAIAAWSRAQRQPIATQLHDGIRLLDLRLCEAQGRYWIHHGLLGPELTSVLDDIAAFLEAAPTEFVVVRATKFAVGARGHDPLVRAVVSRLGDRLFGRGDAHAAAGSPAPLLVQALRGRVVWFYEPDDGNDVARRDARFWGSSTQLYADHWCPRATDEAALARCQERAFRIAPGPFHLQWILTPQPAACARDALRRATRQAPRHAADRHPYGLERLSATLDPARLRRFVDALATATSGRAHVAAISTDMYEDSGSIPLAVTASRQPPRGAMARAPVQVMDAS